MKMIRNNGKIVFVFLLCIFVRAKVVSAESRVIINSANFPDKNFRMCLEMQLPREGDNSVDVSEVKELQLNFTDWVASNGEKIGKIKSLKGIEYFTELEKIEYGGFQMTSLSLPDNRKLKEFIMTSNDDCRIDTLDFSGNPELEVLDCHCTAIKNLNLANNLKLKTLDCELCGLTKLDLSHNTALESLDCARNKLSDIDLSNNTSLSYLSVWGNPMKKLVLLNNPVLKELDCSDCKITVLDTSNNLALNELRCMRNQLTSLNLQNNLALTKLDCDENQLNSLDVSYCKNLVKLWCPWNNLVRLDLSQNEELKELFCSYNPELVSVKMPLSVTKIISKAFFGCDSLKYIYIDDTVTSIADYSLGFSKTSGVSGSSISTYANISAKGNIKKMSLVIGGKKNSAAHRYAKKFGFKFVTDKNYGKKVEVNKTKYRISGDGTAAVFNIQNDITSLTIPDTVKLNGRQYKVTAISAKAFSGKKKLKKVVIGSNVSEIGKMAFYKTSNLKQLVIKSKKLKKSTIGSKAFSFAGSKKYKKLVVTVPRKKAALYKKIFRKRGLNKKVKIRKK